MSGCGTGSNCVAETQACIDIHAADESWNGGDCPTHFDQFDGVYSTTGILSADFSGLKPGLYNADIYAASGAAYVPEPSSALLLALALLALIGMKAARRRKSLGDAKAYLP